MSTKKLARARRINESVYRFFVDAGFNAFRSPARSVTVRGSVASLTVRSLE